MRLQISTDTVPEPVRFAFWNHAVFSTLAVTAEPLPEATGPFRARFSARSKGPLLHSRFQGDGFYASRQGREIAHRQCDAYRVYRETGAGVRFRIAGADLLTGPGDLLVADADAPLEAWPAGPGSRGGQTDQPSQGGHESWLIPKPLIEPHLSSSGRPLVARLSGRSGTEALAASYLETLTRNWETIPESAMAPIVDTLSRLIGVACGIEAADQPNAVCAGRLVEAKRYINAHLAEPGLTPASVASTLRISVRALHLLFEPTGTSFARYVLRRRIEECRTALLAGPARPVTDIAFAWGFTTLSSFYSAFRAAFGMSPGEFRAATLAPRGRSDAAANLN